MVYKYRASAVLMISMFFMIGCTATTMDIYRASEEITLCNKVKNNLGYVAILPEAAWREDQKEPKKREQMALEEIEQSFQKISCGRLSFPGGVRDFSGWSNKSESKLLKEFESEGVDTIILIRIEELSPRFFITFSLPFLWAGTSEVDFRIRALSVKTGAVLADMRIKRSRGGPFNIRPAEWARLELSAALESFIQEP